MVEQDEGERDKHPQVQGVGWTLGVWQGGRQEEEEVQHLHDLVASLAEDLRITLNIIEQHGGQAPRVWLRVLTANAEVAEQEIAAWQAAEEAADKRRSERILRFPRRKRKQQIADQRNERATEGRGGNAPANSGGQHDHSLLGARERQTTGPLDPC